MAIKNYEFKAAVKDLNDLEQRLLRLNPFFKGEDHQIDTYFKVIKGRLKLREGIIENALIYYERPDIKGAKQSDVIIYKHDQSQGLKEILTKIHGIKTVVEKTRRIYFIENVKFHFDRIPGLGKFVEVEAIDESGIRITEQLEEQCEKYRSFFGIEKSDFIAGSYSDLLLAAQK
jgi:adenylate cyclase class 2